MVELSREELLKELAEEAEKIHDSTRVDMPLFSPVHNYLRSKSPTYYKWAISGKSNTLHVTGALGFVVSVFIFMFVQFVWPNLFIPKPEKVLAGSASVTWTSRADFESALTNSNIDFTTNTDAVSLTYGPNVLTDIVDISGGTATYGGAVGGFSVAVKSDGTVWAWGSNGSGQLGQGDTVNRSYPIQVKGPGGSGFLTGVTQVSANSDGLNGLFFVVARKSDGTVWAWGNNDAGNLGQGDTVDQLYPVQVKGPGGSGFLTGVNSVSASGYSNGGNYGFVTAVKADGTAWAWGINAVGQLGTGNTNSSNYPVQVKTGASTYLTNVKETSNGGGSSYGYSAAVKNDGTVWQWGQGVGNYATQVLGPGGSGYLTGASSISVASGANANHYAVVTKSDGTVWAWGNNYSGVLGQGNTTDQPYPVQVKGPGGSGFLAGVAQTSSSYGCFWSGPNCMCNFVIARKTDGTAWAWGGNNTGQLGQGNVTSSSYPVQVKGVGGSGFLSNIIKVKAASGGSGYTQNNAWAINSTGNVFVWGNNNFGQVGNGGTSTSSLTYPVQTLNYNYTTYPNLYISPGALGGSGTGLRFGNPNAGNKYAWKTLSWNGSGLSGNYKAKIQVRSADTWGSGDGGYVNPVTGDGSWYEVTANSGSVSINSSIYNSSSKTIELRLELISSDGLGSPVINDISISYDLVDTPADLKSHRADDGVEISTWTNGSVVSKADIRGVVNNDTLTPQFEVRTDTAFVGTPATPSGVVASVNNITYAGDGTSWMQDQNLGTLSGLSSGTYYYKVRMIDQAGRVSAWSDTYETVSIEQVAPTGSVVINGGAYVNSQNVTLDTSSASDTGGSGLSKMRFSNDGTNWGNWANYSTSANWDLSSGDGSKTVYAQYKDNAGNISGQLQDTTQANFNAGPTKTNVYINPGSYVELSGAMNPMSPSLDGFHYVDDCQVTEGDDTTSATIYTGWWDDADWECSGFNYGYIDFNISGITTPDSATLKFYQSTYALDPTSIQLKHVGTGTTLYTFNTTNGLKTINVTPYVQADKAASRPTSQFRIECSAGFSNWCSGNPMGEAMITASEGGANGPKLEVSSSVGPPYSATGTFESRAINSGSASVKYGNINWLGYVPSGASLSLEARAATTEGGLASAVYSAVSNGGDLSQFNDKQWIQYKASFANGGNNQITPILDDIFIERENYAQDSIILDATTPTVSNYSIETVGENSEYAIDTDRILNVSGTFYDGGNSGDIKVQLSEDGINWGKYSGSGSANSKSTDWTNYIIVTPHETNIQELTNAWYLENGEGEKTIYVRVQDGAGNASASGTSIYTTTAQFSGGAYDNITVDNDEIKLDTAVTRVENLTNSLYAWDDYCEESGYAGPLSYPNATEIRVNFTENDSDSGGIVGIDIPDGNTVYSNAPTTVSDKTSGWFPGNSVDVWVNNVACASPYIAVNWIEYKGGYVESTFTSAAIQNSGNNSAINWNDKTSSPNTGTITMKVIGGDDANMTNSVTSGALNKGDAIPSNIRNKAYLKYQITLTPGSSNTETPIVYDVTLGAEAASDTIILDTAVPSAPGTLNATAISETQINLSWTASTDNGSGVAGYKIERSCVSCDPVVDFEQIDTTSNTSYQNNSGLTGGNTYIYRVRAYDNTNHNSSYSNEKQISTIDAIAPQQPTGLQVSSTVSGDRLDLSFMGGRDGVGIDKYYIYRSTSELGTYTKVDEVDISPNVIDDTGTQRNVTVTGLVDNTAYWFMVSAVDAVPNESAKTSAVPGATPDTTNPVFPVDFSIQVTATSSSAVDLTWTSATDFSSDGQTFGSAQDADGFNGWYRVERSEDEIDWVNASSSCLNIQTESCSDTGLTALTTYYYRVRAVDKAGSVSDPAHSGNRVSSPATDNDNSAETYTDAVPTAPINLSVVYSSGTSSQINFTGATSSLVGGTQGYPLDYYRVYRFTGSEQSGTGVTTNEQLADWISKNNATKVGGDIDVTSQASGSRSGSSYEYVDANTYSLTDSSLTNATTYKYKVVAFDTTPASNVPSGPFASPMSATYAVTTPDATIPDAYNSDGFEIQTDVIYGPSAFGSRIVVNWTHAPEATRQTTATVLSDNTSTIVLSSGGGSQLVNGQFIKIDSEILKITNITSDTLTVSRGQANSQEASHAGGSAVSVLDFTKYRVFKDSGSGFIEITSQEFNSPELNYFVDADIEEGTSYKYKVTVVDSASTFKGYVANQPNQIVQAQNNESQGKETVSLDPSNIDTVAPTISGNAVTVTPGVSSATISWNTDESSTTTVYYGETEGNYTKKAGDITSQGGQEVLKSSGHSAIIRGLESNGKNYYYKVESKDASGNTVSKTGSFQTLSFTVNNVSVEVTSSSAVISWETNIDSSSYVEYRRAQGSDLYKTEGFALMSKDHEVTIKNLSPGFYTYNVKSYDINNNLAYRSLQQFEIPTSDSGAFGTPLAAKVEEKEITATSAKVTWTSTVQTTSWVDYGTASGNYTTSSGNDDLTLNHIVTIENLVPDTTYYYRIRGIDASGIEYISKEYTFKALAQPIISNITVSEVGSYEAVITFSTNINTQAGVDYGKDTGYGKRSQSQDFVKAHQITLTELEDNQTYHFKVEAKDEAGNSVVSEDQVFKTPLDKTAPVISEVKLSPLTGSDDTKRGVIITWVTDKPSTSQVAYSSGVIAGSYNQKTAEDETLTKAHTVVINNLDAGTTYHFQLLSKDKRDNLGRSVDYTMITQEAQESVLELILKTLEDTFSWVGKIGEFFGDAFSQLFSL